MVLTILAGTAAVTAGAVVSSRASRAERRLDTATQLADLAFERIALRSDRLIFHNERTAAQWKKAHERVYRLLLEAKKEFGEARDRSRLELLLGYQTAVAESFEKLEENWNAFETGAIDYATAKRVEDQLMGEMTLESREVADFSSELARESRLELSRAVSLGVTLLVVLVIMLALLVTMDVLIISMGVLRRISAVKEGTEKVAAGDLDFHIDDSGKSEIAELARLFNRMPVKIKRKNEILGGLNEVLHAGLTCEDEGGIARTCLSVAERLTGAAFGFLGLVNEKGLLDTKSLSEPGWKECRMPESEASKLINDMELTSYWGRVIKEGKPQLVNEPASDPDATGTPEGHPPIESFLGVPLKRGEETVGVIALANRKGGFDTEEIEALEALGAAFIEALGRHRAEAELRRHRDHLEEMVGKRTTELVEAIDELERSNAELQQFAYVASHDLQEPLRTVASYTRLLASRYRGKLDSDADDFINFAVDGANRMQRLISDILALSRVATVESEVKRTDANLALGFARANLEVLVDETRAVGTSEDLPEVIADEAKLSQVFQNLIGNALKFRGGEPPRVHVSARQGEGEWVFSVTDNGIGFDQEHAERIFQVFQRLHPRGRYGGTGIGLSISRKIVERHGGRIWAESSPGEGSTFYFTVPDRGGEL